jgi:hypothetical protein
MEGVGNMHYRNGREAKNGDEIVHIGEGGKISGIGILHGATPGSDYCNGYAASTAYVGVTSACLVDAIHVEDLAKLLAEKGLDKRPPGK